MKCECFMYTLEYTKLTLKLKKEELKTYNYALMQLILDEFFQKRFIATKINKPTRNGTTVKFETIEDYQKSEDRLFLIAEELGVKLEKNNTKE